MSIFNEESLKKAIAEQWGDSGAHMDVFNEILKKSKKSDNAILLIEEDDARVYENLKNGEEYKMFALVNDSTNEREGNQVAVYLDSKGTLQLRDYKEFNKKFHSR